jgi:organic hydroperoxide reductase OsmC/OhrA
MADHVIKIEWQAQGAFSHEGFERRHNIQFQSNVSIAAGGAGNEYGADPEQMLAAAMASCHMQTFLALAAKKRLQLVSYSDTAEAELSQRDDGKFWVSRITLNPKAIFSGDKIPDAEAIRAMHEKAHEHCFIANSTSSEVIVNLD